MKKFIALSLVATMLLTLTACSSSEEETTSEDTTQTTTESTQTEDATETTQDSPYDVNDALAAINTANVMNDYTAAMVEDNLVVMGLDSSLYKSFAGTILKLEPGAGINLVVEANEGKAGEVETILNDYKDYLISSQELYAADFPSLFEKIENARIVSKGNYVIFVVAVDLADNTEVNIDEVYENIDIAIDEFFK